MKLDLKEFIKELAQHFFRGADGSRYEQIQNGATFTPTHDGWARVMASTIGGNTYPPVVNILQSNGVIGSGTGITYGGSKLFAFAPVKAGLIYSIDLYRCTLDDIIIFY